MFPWRGPGPVCEIEIDHEGLPTPGDVYIDCGEEIYEEWITQAPCQEFDVRLCEGFYVFLADTEPAQKVISTQLPPPIVQVTVENCRPVYSSSTSICEFEPILVLTGIEPLPDHQIIGIEGLYEGQAFACDPVCRLRLPVTEEPFTIQFWAYSSYGDSSEMFDAQVRVAVRDTGDPDKIFWYGDVLSSQWAGVPVASCVQTWGTLPPVGGPPEWLSTPTDSEALGTDIPYNYLASQLIRQGAVDVSSCGDGGLMPDDSASNCGMEAAREAVRAWQNQFDEIILNVSKDTGVPAHLLKNLFATESQFWPGANLKSDIGLGQLTKDGADTALLWNPPFFRQFCPLVMDAAECSKGYLQLDEEQMQYVRLALIDAGGAPATVTPKGGKSVKVDARIPEADPVARLAAWAGELSSTRALGAVGSSVLGIDPLDDDELFVLRAMLGGEDDDGIARAIAEAYPPDVAADLAEEAPEIAAALRGSALRPILDTGR